jgi:hypothetical protein
VGRVGPGAACRSAVTPTPYLHTGKGQRVLIKFIPPWVGTAQSPIGLNRSRRLAAATLS